VDLESALQAWRDAGPLSEEFTKLLIDLREAGMTEQPQDLIWAAFVRSLTKDEQSALMALLQMVDRDEAFRWF
jgi:hypothetical protein